MAFRKYPVLHELETRHGIHLQDQRFGQKLHTFHSRSTTSWFSEALSSITVYSFLMDRSVNAGRVEDELIVILYGRMDNPSKEIRSCMRFFSVQVSWRCSENAWSRWHTWSSESARSQRLVGGAQTEHLSIYQSKTEWEALVSRHYHGYFGCGAMLTAWSLLARTLCRVRFSTISRWIRLYYQLAKKSRELTDIVDDLREVFDFSRFTFKSAT